MKVDHKEIGWGGVGWFYLPKGREKWRALVNAVMDLRVYKMLGKYRVATQVI
jgi:hypothetical protein